MKEPPELIAGLRSLQRQRSVMTVSRIRLENRFYAIIANDELGYHSGQSDKEREKVRKKAEAHVKAVMAGEQESSLQSLIMTHVLAIRGLKDQERILEKAQIKTAKELRCAAWVDLPEQKGFTLYGLAKIIGESGDLADYANPAKLWKRMGCAPFEANGQILMPASWRKIAERKGGLSSDQWTEAGYPPRRRSLMYVIGEALLKTNGKGPYRARYDQAKATFTEKHPDYNKMRCHLHGMLCMVKMLLRNLWCEWNGKAVGWRSGELAPGTEATSADHKAA